MKRSLRIFFAGIAAGVFVVSCGKTEPTASDGSASASATGGRGATGSDSSSGSGGSGGSSGSAGSGGSPCTIGFDCDVKDWCEGAWRPGPLAPPSWIDPAATCVEDPVHSPPQAYDTCSVREGQNPFQCGIPDRGAIYCYGNRLTVTCRTASDCPASMVCIRDDGLPGDDTIGEPGRCEKTCTGSSAAECGRCDLECNANLGYCWAAQPKKACKANCECGTNPCVNGFCVFGLGGWIPNLADYCLPADRPETCACRGGVCREDGCCELPDETIAQKDSPECARE